MAGKRIDVTATPPEGFATSPVADGSGAIFERVLPAYQQVEEQLRAAILRGAVSPGDRLPNEAQLATNFGVSRGTVREALRVLSSHNLVYSVRGAGGGTFVAESNTERMSDYLETSIGLLMGSRAITSEHLLEVREALEIPAVRLAARRRSPEQIDELRSTLEKEKSEGRRVARTGLTQHFHEVLLDAAANPLLTVMTTPVLRIIHARFREDVPSMMAWPDLDGDHDEILERIEAGDVDGAERAMRAHLDRMWSATTGDLDHESPTDDDTTVG